LPRTITDWTGDWRAGEDHVAAIAEHMRAGGAPVTFGTGYHRWDLECRGGLCASARARLAVEEHGARRQLVRVRIWPRCSMAAIAVFLALTALAVTAAWSGAPIAAVILGTAAALLGARVLYETCAAMASFIAALTPTAGGSGS